MSKKTKNRVKKMANQNKKKNYCQSYRKQNAMKGNTWVKFISVS